MVKGSNSEQTQSLTSQSGNDLDDIPVALRDGPDANLLGNSQSQGWLKGRGVWAIVLFMIGLVLAIVLSRFSLFSWQPQNVAESSSNLEPTQSVQSNRFPSSQPGETINSDPSIETMLGHRKYEEASLAELVPIVADGSLMLRQAAANAWFEMEEAAKASGIYLAPLSAFRSKETQEYLFFEIKQERGQDPKKRAEVSAPPGYSEHHTGYAIDIGDLDFPDSYLSESFENTPAFQWLAENAVYYSFELSFPRNNPQGISYEPWHWRYVGNPESLEIFYKNLN